MQLEYFLQNREQSNTLIPQLIKEHKTLYEWKAFKEYFPCEHDVMKEVKRPNKTINVPDPNNENVTIQKVVPLNRIPLSLQKLIVSRKTAFVTGGQVSLQAKPVTEQERKLYEEVNFAWRNNKLQFKNSDIFKRMVSETECAEIWYSKVNDDKTVSLRVNIYSPYGGYDLVPVFDAHGDLIAFGLGYEEEIESKKIQYFDVYDNEFITRHIKEGSDEWKLRDMQGVQNPLPNPYGKIPVIYYQSKPAWEDVQQIIERLETLMSNFGDVNDYNGSPILFAQGDIKGFSAKGETGKVIQGENDAKLDYVSWDHAPESIKLELETLENYIFTLTQTPNISFKEMKSLGQALSGAAMDRMLIDAHLNARDYHNGSYGEGIQRRVNLLKNMLASIYTDLKKAVDMEITPQFSIFSIDNDEDKVKVAMQANGNKPVWGHKQSIQYAANAGDDIEETYKELSGATATEE